MFSVYMKFGSLSYSFYVLFCCVFLAATVLQFPVEKSHWTRIKNKSCEKKRWSKKKWRVLRAWANGNAQTVRLWNTVLNFRAAVALNKVQLSFLLFLFFFCLSTDKSMDSMRLIASKMKTGKNPWEFFIYFALWFVCEFIWFVLFTFVILTRKFDSEKKQKQTSRPSFVAKWRGWWNK